MSTRPGPKPKGDREQITARFPRGHLDVYRQRAEQAGMSLSDYLALTLARAHDLGEPGYLHRQPTGQDLLIAS